jgi:hypothetical protein
VKCRPSFVYIKRSSEGTPMKREKKEEIDLGELYSIDLEQHRVVGTAPIGHALSLFPSIHSTHTLTLWHSVLSFPAFCIIQSVSFLFTWSIAKERREGLPFSTLSGSCCTDRFPILLNLLVDSFRLMDGLPFSQPRSIRSLFFFRMPSELRISFAICNVVRCVLFLT